MAELFESEAAKLFTASPADLANWSIERIRLDALEHAVTEELRQRFEQASRKIREPSPAIGRLSEMYRLANEELLRLERLGRIGDARAIRELEEQLAELRKQLEVLQHEIDLARAIQVGDQIAGIVARNATQLRAPSS